MITLTQHIPGFVEGAKPYVIQADSLKALLQMSPWPRIVETNGHEFFGADSRFYRWSLADNEYLMAEFDEGTRWFTIGYLRFDVEDRIDLPIWTADQAREAWKHALDAR